MRECVLQSSAFILTYSPVARSMVRSFSLQFFPRDFKRVIEIFENLTKNSIFGYLLVDLGVHTKDKYRLRMCITPEESPMQVFIFKK